MPLSKALAAARGAPAEKEAGSEESSSPLGTQEARLTYAVCTCFFDLRSSAKKKQRKKHKKRTHSLSSRQNTFVSQNQAHQEKKQLWKFIQQSHEEEGIVEQLAPVGYTQGPRCNSGQKVA